MSEMLAIVGLVLVCYLAYLMRRIVAGINRIGYHIVGVSVCHVWGTDLRQADIHKTINRNFLFEIKNPARPPSARKLTPDETFWYRDWAGQVDVIHSAAEAITIIETEMGK